MVVAVVDCGGSGVDELAVVVKCYHTIAGPCQAAHTKQGGVGKCAPGSRGPNEVQMAMAGNCTEGKRSLISGHKFFVDILLLFR